MGAWSTNLFGNDSALDLLLLLERADANSSLLRNTIRNFLRTKKADASLEERALAACAVIAAAAFHPVRGIAADARKWIETSGYVPEKKDILLAHQAATRIAAASELSDLWQESGGLKKWKTGVDTLITSLAKALKSDLPRREPKPPSIPKLLWKQLDLHQRHPSPQLKTLIQRKVASLTNLNAISADTGTDLPLTLLIKRGFVDEAKALIEKGADPTLIEPRFGHAPAHLEACSLGDLSLVKFIYARGVSPFGYYAQDHVTKRLLQFATPADFPAGVAPKRYSPPLAIALRRGHLEVARFLVGLGADVREDFFGETGLHWAIQSGDLQTVQFVLNHGVELNSASRLGETALHLVLKAGKDRCAIAKSIDQRRR